MLAVGLVAGSPPARVAADGGERRSANVVLIVADDLGYCGPDLGHCDGIPTPHIGSIAENGVLFTDGYVTSPACRPSRAGLLTGRYPQRFGLELNPSQDRDIHDPSGLPDSETTLAAALGRAGYVSGLVGKWHLGVAAEFHPLSRGFDEFFGFLGGHRPYGPARVSAKHYEPRTLRRNREPTVEPDYLTDAFGREASHFIERNARVPFLLVVAFNAPHTPLTAPARYQELFPAIDDRRRRTYAGMVAALDRAIGRILQSLRRADLFEDSLVLFLSDNGCPQADGYCGNAGLRGGKQSLFEGGIRVPFAVQWPRELEAGGVLRDPVSSLDVYPTALAAAGVDPPGDVSLDGIDLIPYMKGTTLQGPHARLTWRIRSDRAIREGNWKLVKARGRTWLFDLERDRGEIRDRAKENPEIVQRLDAELREWEASLREPHPHPDPRDGARGAGPDRGRAR
jgi:arylsulfatase A-like enzyme